MACGIVNHRELKRRRLGAGIKAEQVAMDTDRSKEAVLSWEAGRAEPPLVILMKLAEIYRCELSDLVMKEPASVDTEPVEAPAQRRRLPRSPPRRTGAA
jgi:transcriptional regulator with XRE-family HTH domain